MKTLRRLCEYIIIKLRILILNRSNLRACLQSARACAKRRKSGSCVRSSVRPRGDQWTGVYLCRRAAPAAIANSRLPVELSLQKRRETTTQPHRQSSARPTCRASPVSRASAESCQQFRPWDLDPPALGRPVVAFARRSRPCSRPSGSGGSLLLGFALIPRAFGVLRTC